MEELFRKLLINANSYDLGYIRAKSDFWPLYEPIVKIIESDQNKPLTNIITKIVKVAVNRYKKDNKNKKKRDNALTVGRVIKTLFGESDLSIHQMFFIGKNKLELSPKYSSSEIKKFNNNNKIHRNNRKQFLLLVAELLIEPKRATRVAHVIEELEKQTA